MPTVHLGLAVLQRQKMNNVLSADTDGILIATKANMRPSFMTETELFENGQVNQDDAFIIESKIEVRKLFPLLTI